MVKYRIGPAILDPLSIYIQVDVYPSDADMTPDPDGRPVAKPVAGFAVPVEDSDTFSDGATRLIEKCLEAETLLEHNERFATERAQRFEVVRQIAERYTGAVLDGVDLRRLADGLAGGDE